MAFDFKKTWGSITESAKKTAGDISEKTKVMAEKSKLKSKINTEENNINKKYLELGKLAYDMAKKQNITEFDEIVKDIDLGVSEIEKLKREIEKLDGCVSELLKSGVSKSEIIEHLNKSDEGRT